MEPGIYPDMPPEKYHAVKALSNSGMKILDKSPAHFKYWVDNPTEATPAMIIGTCFHLAVLEPDRFYQDVTVFDGHKRGKAWDEFQTKNDGKIILSVDDYNSIIEMQKAVHSHPVAGPLVETALTEESIFWKDARFDFLCKCRPDIRRPDYALIADLKSCLDASPNGFAKDIANFSYHTQAPFYLNGVNAVQDIHYETFLFIAVEKKPPYQVAVYNAKDIIQRGMEKIRSLTEIYNECLISNEWPGYETDIIDIWLPSWAA